MIVSMDYKYSYADEFMLNKNANGLGFFANNLDFFFYELPMSLVVLLVLLLVFKLLFNHRVSRYFRKYAFAGVFLFVLYEGNVEQFAFYFFMECRNLFSLNFSHKLVNIMLVYFFALLVLSSVGGLLWFLYHYRKLLKYFLEDSK